jgi:hypothetical protein
MPIRGRNHRQLRPERVAHHCAEKIAEAKGCRLGGLICKLAEHQYTYENEIDLLPPT